MVYIGFYTDLFLLGFYISLTFETGGFPFKALPRWSNEPTITHITLTQPDWGRDQPASPCGPAQVPYISRTKKSVYLLALFTVHFVHDDCLTLYEVAKALPQGINKQ
uniref:Uncharacterized protein n=1 Tax=Cacopsylla melanoneura TaxID=428564 RepID=A0A8D8TQ99_9HEMI